GGVGRPRRRRRPRCARARLRRRPVVDRVGRTGGATGRTRPVTRAAEARGRESRLGTRRRSTRRRERGDGAVPRRVVRRCPLRPPGGATTTYDDFAPNEWARRWPAEQIWKVRKRA